MFAKHPFASNIRMKNASRKAGSKTHHRRVNLSSLHVEEREATCPHCHITILGSPMDTILLAQSTCPNCGRGFRTIKDVPVRCG